MQEIESQLRYGYACIWTYPDEGHAGVFALILRNILTGGRTHLKPYYPNTTEIDAIDLTHNEQLILKTDAENKIGKPDGLLRLTLDKLGINGDLNLGLIAVDPKTVVDITSNHTGISKVQFRAEVYQNPEGLFIPIEHPLGKLTSIVRFK